jgi:MFS family permease
MVAGVALVVAFVVWELRAREPMVPMSFFRRRAFSAANLTSVFMSFGMFGSIFLLAQFFQIVQHYSPLQAGLRTLPWTAMPMLVAPIAGILSDRIGSRPLLIAGMALMASALGWLAVISSPTVPYADLVPAFVMAGVGMSLYFAPVANLVLSSVSRSDEGKASGVNNTVREVGGVFGVAVLASVFAAAGSYLTPISFVNGLTAALWVGAAAVGVATFAAIAIPPKQDIVDSVSYLPGAEGDQPDVGVGGPGAQSGARYGDAAARFGEGRPGEPALIPVRTNDDGRGEMIG